MVYNFNKNITSAITACDMASRKLSASEVLALLHPSDEDVFDDDIYKPVQDGSDEEFDDSEDDDFSGDGYNGTGGEELFQDSDEDRIEDRINVSESCEFLHKLYIIAICKCNNFIIGETEGSFQTASNNVEPVSPIVTSTSLTVLSPMATTPPTQPSQVTTPWTTELITPKFHPFTGQSIAGLNGMFPFQTVQVSLSSSFSRKT